MSAVIISHDLTSKYYRTQKLKLMDKKYYFLIAALLIIGAIIYFIVRPAIPSQQDEQTAVKCANKTVFRYKYPSKIFPVIINDYSANFKIASGVLNQLASDSSGGSSVSTDVKNSARQLRDTLNQDNIFFENNLKAYFLASNDDPCNDSLRYMYTAYIKEMTEKIIQLKQFIAQVSAPANSTTNKNIPRDSLLAVVDPARSNVDTGTKNITPDKLIVKRDYTKLNVAIDKLQDKYMMPKLKYSPVMLTK